MTRNFPAIILILACPFAAFSAPPSLNLPQQLTTLNNPDPALRDQAREELMLLKRSDLDALRQAVARAHPLSPEQIAALHEIVAQVILADAATQTATESSKGFLGARLEECQVPGPDGAMRPAILVSMRIAGFDSYRMLRTGDVILGVDGDTQVTRDKQTFTAQIQSHSPGQTVSLQILRCGHSDKVNVTLCPRPVSADNLALPELVESQQESVEQYWRTTFEPIITQDETQRGPAHRR